MAFYTIETVDGQFAAASSLVQEPSADAALALGLHAAMDMVTEDICGGSIFAAIEVIIKDASGKRVRRSAVSVAVAPLALAPAWQSSPSAANDR